MIGLHLFTNEAETAVHAEVICTRTQNSIMEDCVIKNIMKNILTKGDELILSMLVLFKYVFIRAFILIGCLF